MLDNRTENHRVPSTQTPKRGKPRARPKTPPAPESSDGFEDLDNESLPPSWQSRAVERSLERSRAAAEKRSKEFVTAALKLVDRRGGEDFTVQELATEMRISTRTFYLYFSSKEELLVAMFEEVQRQHNRELRVAARAAEDPLARLEAFVFGVLERAHTGSRWYAVGRLLIQQFLQLQISHPDGLRQSYEGLLSYLTKLLVEASAGNAETDEHRRVAALVLHMIVSATQAMVVGSPIIDPAPTPDEVWQFCRNGISLLIAGESGTGARSATRPRTRAAN